MQEVLLELWRTASRFDGSKGSATSWVMTLAHRRAVDRVRSYTWSMIAKVVIDPPVRDSIMPSQSRR